MRELPKPEQLTGIGESATVFQAFAAAVATWADRPFFHVPSHAAKAYSDRAIEWTYGRAGQQVTELAGRYARSGLQPGQRVGLLLGNRAEFFLHYLALNSLDAAVVPLSAEATAVELVHILRDSHASLVVALNDHRPLLTDTFTRLDKAPVAAWLGNDGSLELAPCRGATAAAPDEAALLYTSGSTGDPKGCIIPNSYLLAMGRWYQDLGGLCALKDGQERLITPLPLMHMNALAASSMGMIMSGGCIVQLDRFHPSTWWDSVRESGATIVHYLGVMPAMLLQMPPSPLDMAHTVKFGFGAGVHPKHHAAFEQRFGFPLVESWSMTEVGAGAVVTAQREPRHIGTRCFGRPEPFMQYRIMDDQGGDVAPGAAGEFWVRAAGANPRAGFFAGYANQSALTEAAWEHDFFHTGDIVRLGEDGSLHFVDRKKSIIRRSGENIASLEVEAVLNQLPQVRSVGVGPVDDELRGEEVMACIELAAGHCATAETAQSIFAAAGERLVYFKLPGYVAFVEALPLTPSQKLQRGVLKQLSHTLVDSGRVFDLRALKKRPAKPEAAA